MLLVPKQGWGASELGSSGRFLGEGSGQVQHAASLQGRVLDLPPYVRINTRTLH